MHPSRIELQRMAEAVTSELAELRARATANQQVREKRSASSSSCMGYMSHC